MPRPPEQIELNDLIDVPAPRKVKAVEMADALGLLKAMKEPVPPLEFAAEGVYVNDGPFKKAAPKKKQSVPDQKNPITRVSLYGNIFPKSVEDNWKHYEDIGWVHADEMGSFKKEYFPCSFSGKYTHHTQMVKTAQGDRVARDNIVKAGLVQCGYSSVYTLPADLVDGRLPNGKIAKVSSTAVKTNGGFQICDYTHHEYVPGSLGIIYGSEKYKKVAMHILQDSEEFAGCAKCSKWHEIKDVPKRDQDDFHGQRWCAPCFMKAIRKNIILKHDSDDYPAPIPYVASNWGYKIVDGFVVSTKKKQENKDKFRAVRMYGVELETEMSVAGCKKDNLTRIDLAMNLRVALGEDFVMTKEDGSLIMNGKYSDGEGNGPSYAGFEIVSAPANLEVHREKWCKITEAVGYKHLRSWDTDTCGFHVHVSREALTSLQIHKIQTFINHPKNQEFVQKVSGRPSCEYYKYKPRKALSVITMEAKCNETRRWAINLTNPKTVEFRIFRGTVNPRHIMRNLEFCDAICDYCHPGSRSFLELGDYRSFISFVNDRRKLYPMLAEWFALHNIIKVRALTAKTDVAKLTLRPDKVEEPEIKLDKPMRVIPGR